MFFGPNLGTRNAKTHSDPSKSRNVTKKQLNSKKLMSFKWLLRVLKEGWAKMMTSARIRWTSYHYISIRKKTDVLNWNVFFIANCIPSRVFWGFEQLSSSFWRRVIAWGEMPTKVVFEGAKFWSIFGLWAIIFAPDILQRHARALKMRILV